MCNIYGYKKDGYKKEDKKMLFNIQEVFKLLIKKYNLSILEKIRQSIYNSETEEKTFLYSDTSEKIIRLIYSFFETKFNITYQKKIHNISDLVDAIYNISLLLIQHEINCPPNCSQCSAQPKCSIFSSYVAYTIYIFTKTFYEHKCPEDMKTPQEIYDTIGDNINKARQAQANIELSKDIYSRYLTN
jgi:hypothetical protein